MLTEITNLTLFNVAISTIMTTNIHVVDLLSLYGEIFTHQKEEMGCFGEIFLGEKY